MKIKPRHIIYVTGSRSEYGRMRASLFSIRDNKNLKLSLIVAGMHLSDEFGCTVKEIERDGFDIIARINIIAKNDTGLSMVEALADSMKSIADEISRNTCDLILLLGDRGEMLSSSLAGAHMNIPVVHIGGGYKSGSVDDRLRDAITIFSDFHLTANKVCAARVTALGADPSKVFIVGAPDLDAINKREFDSSETLRKEFGIDPKKPLILVSQHSVTTEVESAGEQIRETMEAITKLGMQTIIIYPNSDAGGRSIIDVLTEYKHLPFIQIFKNIPYEKYLGLLNESDVLVGNSSAGIIEAPSFGLPVVNIGTRQKGRERSKNVIDTNYEHLEILAAIRKALSIEFKQMARQCENPYGDGKTYKRIPKLLANIDLTR